jgi:hypothetical protein
LIILEVSRTIMRLCVCVCFLASSLCDSESALSSGARFVAWLKDGGVDLDAMGVEIADFPKNGGRGIRATRDIEEGAIALQVSIKPYA